MLSLLLFPFAFLYGLVVRFRNLLYDFGLKKSSAFDRAVISVGNLNVGGTGKTPMVEYLVNLLSPLYSVAILSRGYGRNTRGFLLAEMHDDATTLGDEPFQFYRKYGSRVEVVVCERRAEGISMLLKRRPQVQVILLDDAFQHRAVTPLFSVLLTDFSKPFFDDHLLPMGRLREPRSGAARADAIVVTKCLSLSDETRSSLRSNLERYGGSRPVFFSVVGYQVPRSMEGAQQIGEGVILVTGIANSRPMVDYVAAHFKLIHHFHFNDHHRYSPDDIRMIQQKAGVNASILTTEKDIVKLISPEWKDLMDKKLWFYLPIETHLIDSGSEFDKLLLTKIDDHLKSLPKI